MITVKLRRVAYARSGDKGTTANIGVIAYTQPLFLHLRQILTAERVRSYFLPLGAGVVERYELPNLWAFNFVLPELLHGGGSRSLHIDAQGKALGQAILEMDVAIPEALL